MAAQQLFIPAEILDDWAQLDDPVEAIATWLEVSDEIMKEFTSSSSARMRTTVQLSRMLRITSRGMIQGTMVKLRSEHGAA